MCPNEMGTGREVRHGSTTMIEKVVEAATDVYGEGNDAISVPVWTPTWFMLLL